MLNKQSWTADRGGPPAWGLVEGLTTPRCKKEIVTNPLDKPRNWTDSLVRPQLKALACKTRCPRSSTDPG